MGKNARGRKARKLAHLQFSQNRRVQINRQRKALMEKTQVKEEELAIGGFTQNRCYRVQVFEDPEAGWLEVKWPVNFAGEPDTDRVPLFKGRTIMGGRFNIQFDIKALGLEEAFIAWKDACTTAVKEFRSKMAQQALASAANERIPPKGPVKES